MSVMKRARALFLQAFVTEVTRSMLTSLRPHSELLRKEDRAGAEKTDYKWPVRLYAIENRIILEGVLCSRSLAKISTVKRTAFKQKSKLLGKEKERCDF